MSTATAKQPNSLATKIRREWPLAASIVTTILFFIFSHAWFEHLANPFAFIVLFGWLFIVILLSAFAIVRHVEIIAERVGEPLGTLILTLAVTGLEVMMIAAVMLGGQGEITMARDAMFAVVMLMLNGMVGASLVVGGLKYHEQTYNLMGANAFLAVIVPLAVLGLVLPNYTQTTPGPTFSTLQAIFIIIMSLGLYGIFLGIQTVRHRAYFVEEESPHDGPIVEPHAHGGDSGALHTVMLFAYLLPVVILAKKLAIPINHAVHVLHAPPALGGLLVAVLILSPESLAAVKSAQANQLPRREHPARLSPGNHRLDHPLCPDNRLFHPPANRPGHQPDQHAAAGADARRQHPHLRRHAHECAARRGAFAALHGVCDHDFRLTELLNAKPPRYGEEKRRNLLSTNRTNGHE